MEKEPISQVVYCLINSKGRYYHSKISDESGTLIYWADLPTEGRLFASKRIAENENTEKGLKAELCKIVLKPEPLINESDSKHGQDVWHGPDVVPPYMKAMYESVEVINQSGEKVLYDLLDDQWFSADNPGREAHVEKWSYLEPIKR